MQQEETKLHEELLPVASDIWRWTLRVERWTLMPGSDAAAQITNNKRRYANARTPASNLSTSSSVV
jgi:hypothetical protein